MTLKQLIHNIISDVIKPVIPLLIGLAVVFFIIGIIKFIASAGDEDKRREGKNIMVWGIIGLFVIVSMWGLVGLLSNTFFGGPTAPSLDRDRYNYGILPGELEGVDNSGWGEYNGNDSESLKDIYDRVNR